MERLLEMWVIYHRFDNTIFDRFLSFEEADEGYTLLFEYYQKVYGEGMYLPYSIENIGDFTEDQWKMWRLLNKRVA